MGQETLMITHACYISYFVSSLKNRFIRNLFLRKVKIPWKHSSFFIRKDKIENRIFLADPLPLVKFDRNGFSQSTFKFIVSKEVFSIKKRFRLVTIPFL